MTERRQSLSPPILPIIVNGITILSAARIKKIRDEVNQIKDPLSALRREAANLPGGKPESIEPIINPTFSPPKLKEVSPVDITPTEAQKLEDARKVDDLIASYSLTLGDFLATPFAGAIIKFFNLRWTSDNSPDKT